MTIMRLFASDALRDGKCVCQVMISRKVLIQTMKYIIQYVIHKPSKHYW